MIQFTKKVNEQFFIGCQLSALIGSGLSILSVALSAIDLTDNDSDATAIVLSSITPTVTLFGTEIRFLVRDGTILHKYLINGLLTLTPGSTGQLVAFSIIMNVV